MLCPNNKQSTKMFQTAGAARFAYNWALAYESENHKFGGKFINDSELRRIFTALKRTDEYSWLYRYSGDATKQAIKDACEAFKRFFNACVNRIVQIIEPINNVKNNSTLIFRPPLDF